MANQTITSGGTYTLSQTLTVGTNVEFLNNSGDNGVLILQPGAFGTATTTVSGTLSASAYIGGSVLDFQPGKYGIPGDQITIQAIETLFNALDVAITASSDNASFGQDITFAAKSGGHILVRPNGTVVATTGTPLTFDANQQLVVGEIAQALFGTAAVAAGAILDISLADSRVNPNSNNPFIDAIVTADTAINPCFAAGTRILTTGGEVEIEALTVGDMLITRDGEEQAILWIGKRETNLAIHPKPQNVRPILIEADALGDGVPARNLRVSPDHALFLDGVLVPAKELINWTSIRQDTSVVTVTYYHIELARHDIIFAEAAPAESYLDTGHRAIFDNAQTSVIAHPSLMQQRRESESCAPLCLFGPTLDSIRQKLAARQSGIRLG
ncbi:MAG: hypothetical protein B7X08_07075 [Acidocella sp. 20-63-7]|nr:MAG: hypothetical protein B7X08_07075 [Acidocella sp. 20-63-7]